MKQIRLIISFLTLIVAFASVGCTLSETVEVQIIYAPQFHSSFAVSDALVGVNNARIFIYNSDHLLIRDTTLNDEQLRSTEPTLLVRGVAEGDYTMVSYYNVDRISVSGSEVGTSTIDQLKLDLDRVEASHLRQVGVDAGHFIDSVCHSFVPFTVQRGTPTITKTAIEPIHYFVTVRVTGLDKPTAPIGELSVKLIDLPTSLDSRAVVSGKYDIDIPLYSVSPAESAGSAMSLKFSSEGKVKLHIFESRVLNQTMLLEPEDYFTAGVPSNQLNISVEFRVNICIVSVNDWAVGEFEIVNFGG